MNGESSITAIERVEIEAAVARAVADGVTDVMDGEWGDREWLHLFVDFEIAAEGDRSSGISFALARLSGQPVDKVSFRLPHEAKRLLGQLADAMSGPSNVRWTCAQLRVERDGRYSFSYSYEPPHRLGGNLLDNRFKDYLTTWLASEDGGAFRPASAP
ncbi:MAG: hypothetical protein ABW164_07150 [Sphingobium sp.]